MNRSQTPNRRRLFKLLDGIIGEERTFKRHTRDLAAKKDNPGETDHSNGAILDDELERLRLAHEEIFDTHRRFINEHELLVQRCLTISRQTRAGLLNENEMALEVERLQRELARIKKEHSLVEQQSRKILRRRGRRRGSTERKA